MSMSSPLIDNVNKIYQKSTYLEKYGGSLIFSIFAVSDRLNISFTWTRFQWLI